MELGPEINSSHLPGVSDRTFLVKLGGYVLNLPKPITYAAGYGFLFPVTVAELLTHSWLGFARLYMLSILLVTWSAGRRAGLLISVVSSTAWLVCDLLSPHPFIPSVLPYWNALMKLALFFMSVVLLSALRDAWLDERKLARTDFLTGVANRRHFFELANREIKRCLRYRHSFIVSYIDIDDFKQVNDRFGHNQGDTLLRLAAQTVKSNVREVDIVARLGGDEFVILFPETGHASAAQVMQKIRSCLMSAMKEHGWRVTFSCGTVTYLSPPVSVDEMLKNADDLMYAVKQTGKNTIKYEVMGKTL